MIKIFAIAILFFCVIDAEAQRLDKIVERIDRIEKNKKFDNSLLTLDLTGKKFALIKNVNKVVYKMIIYVLYYCNFQGEDEYKGAFSTHENAQAVIDRYHWSDRCLFTICEEQLDDY